jgi:flagellar biosynthetic protein FlhB
MMAPQVVAKGAGFVAERIKKVAREISIPIIENKTLAQTLYRVVEIGDFIPVNLYRAVAEILAYVYRLKAARSHNR